MDHRERGDLDMRGMLILGLLFLVGCGFPTTGEQDAWVAKQQAAINEWHAEQIKLKALCLERGGVPITSLTLGGYIQLDRCDFPPNREGK